MNKLPNNGLLMNRYAIYAIAWFVLSAYGFFMRPPSVGVPLFPHFDKFVHFALFFGQLWMVARAYTSQMRPVNNVLWAGLALVWAIAIEVIQNTLPSRSADVWDVVADVIGALCALAIAHCVIQNRLRLEKESHHES